MFTVKGGISGINISCTRSHKRFRMHWLCLEMVGSVFLVVIRCVTVIMLNLSAFYDAHTV